MFTEYGLVNMAIRHKHLKLEQTKLTRAKKLIGAKTEQETVERALDILLDEEPILRSLRSARGIGGVEDLFTGK